MVRNESKYAILENDLRDDKYWGGLLNEALPPVLDYRNWECYGIERDGKPLVAWAYHSYTGIENGRYSNYEAEMAIAAFTKRWATKKRIGQMLSLFFHRSMYNRLTALIRSDNWQAVKLVKLAGFTLEGIIRKPRNELDILQFSMLKEDWEKSRFYVSIR